MRKIVEKRRKAYKYRLYPNKEQEAFLNRNFECVRFIYNRMLSDKIAYYQSNGKMLHNTPAQYKLKFPWLKEADSLALANAQQNLETAFRNFFRDKSIGFPKYKSKKHSRKSYTTNNQNGTVCILDGKYIRLPKVGPVRVKLHRQIPSDHKIKQATISKDPSGKYYVSVLTEYSADIPEHDIDRDNVIGLDYSSPHFYVDHSGAAADMPHFFRSAEEKLSREQRKLSKMVKDSANYKKQKRIVALAYEKVRHQRKDWIEKESRRMADLYDAVCIEDLDMQNMEQGLHLGKATADNAFGLFRTKLSCKLAEQGKKLITIDKWFPSSKTCRFCDFVNADLRLNDRIWTCPCCCRSLNRDENAAINIRNKGLSLIFQS